jgi:hypothetical protein
MRNNNAGCLSALLPAFARIMLLMEWISRPVQWNAAFSTFIIPCLGFLFLPFTTLMYVWLVQGAGGITGFDWLWLGLAVFCDIASLGSAGYANRNRMPGMAPATTTTPPPPSQPPSSTPGSN